MVNSGRSSQEFKRREIGLSKTTGHNPIWITWERQRRSVVLSNQFGADYCELLSKRKGLVRYFSLTLRTLRILFRRRQRLLFVQNPSMILASLAGIYRMCRRGMVLIVDRHSNFFPVSKSNITNKIHDLLSKFTIRKADITIVTNDHLKKVVEALGGHGLVLADKIPHLHKTSNIDLKGKKKVLFICSFDPDEPIKEVIEAARLLNGEVIIYVTGNYRKLDSKDLLKSIPQNLVLLGFLNEQDYIDHLYAVEAVIVLTNLEHTLLCGAYEAVAAERPIVLSNKRDLVEYFNKGVVRTENNAESIAFAIRQVIEKKENLKEEIRVLKIELNKKWDMKFKTIERHISSLLTHNKRRV